MELRQLVTFRMVALTLNFSRAAEALNYVPSNVSMQIQSLEEELGVKLFDRLNKQIILTDAGERFYKYVERILNDVEEAKNNVNDSENMTGTITISANEILCVYLLPAILHEFRKQYPNVRVIFRPTPSNDLKQSIYEGKTDVVFILEEPVNSNGLNIELLREESFRLLVAPNHPLASQSKVDFDDIQGEFFLLNEKGCTYHTTFDRLLVREGANDFTTLEFDSVEAIKQCAMLGMGIAFLPEISVASELEQGKLVSLSLDLTEINFVSQMIWHKGKWISPVIQVFLDIARSSYQHKN
ncbi:LysR family transcriptional regulator [Bacillus sp. Root147]|nr:LysR family transcriptional regulator [Bacillus sp. Root147]MEB2274686.1 LysR family transcriptional regulator [Bacillus sp. ILBB4]